MPSLKPSQAAAYNADMPASRPALARLAWIVSFTILLAALLPTLSHAVMQDRAGSLADICSATGARVVMLSSGDTAATDDGQGEKSSAASSMNCPYCTLHHGAPALLPPALAVQPPAALGFEVPHLFLSAPRPLFAWASARARAPPRIG